MQLVSNIHRSSPYNRRWPHSGLLDNGDSTPTIPFLNFSLNINNNIMKGEFLSTSGKNLIKPKIGMREITGNYTIKYTKPNGCEFTETFSISSCCNINGLNGSPEPNGDVNVDCSSATSSSFELDQLPSLNK